MTDINQLLNAAQANGHHQLSEYESKQILSAYGIPTVQETLTKDLKEALSAATQIRYPVALKACSPEVAHKTETGLIAKELRNESDLSEAFNRMQGKVQWEKGGFLVQEMVQGDRELVIGMIRDPQFGPCVMFGLGGVFTEALSDVSFRAAPISRQDAIEMMQEIKGNKILSEFRGMTPVDRDRLCKCLMALGQIGLDQQKRREIDVNPRTIKGGHPIAVDGLVVLGV